MKANQNFFQASVVVSILLIVLTAYVGSMYPKKREGFMDCASSGSCQIATYNN